MRRFVALLILAAAAIVAVPIAATTSDSGEAQAVDQQRSAVAVQDVAVSLPALREEAAMVLVGTALIGLGAAVRRAA